MLAGLIILMIVGIIVTNGIKIEIHDNTEEEG